MSGDKPIPETALDVAERIFDATDGCACDDCRDKAAEMIRAALMAERERIAAEAVKLATERFDRCTERFEAGDQGSAIIERMEGKALQDFATAIRNGA